MWEKYELKRKFNNQGVRIYRHKGVWLPSVTSVLGKTGDKTGLDKWRDRLIRQQFKQLEQNEAYSSYPTSELDKIAQKLGMAEAKQIGNDAAERGSALHTCIESYLLGEKGLDEIDEHIIQQIDADPNFPRIEGFWASIKPFLERVSNPKIIEYPVWSVEGRIAGTCDCVAEVDGELSVIDWKTSSKFKRIEWVQDYMIQLASYRQAVKEVYGVEIPRAYIAVAREKGFQEFTLNEVDLDLYWWELLDRREEFREKFKL